MSSLPPTILVIIGITGDLARRKLIPAITQISNTEQAPKDFLVLGITRKNIELNEIIEPNTSAANIVELYRMDLADPQAYVRLKEDLARIQTNFTEQAQILFYVSVPPQASRPIIEHLGNAGLNTPNIKLLLEKPFGTDISSAAELIESIQAHFTEEQTYRIDHYLAKEMAQNLIVFRNSNSLFKQTWHNAFIASIDITASETIGIEGRGAFYEQTGALRDLVQSHLLQLLALTLMELPEHTDWATVPQKRLAALRSLSIAGYVHDSALRGQYTAYRQETNSPASNVETFVQLKLASAMPAWQNVPITITTGKALNEKATTIRIRYRQQHEHEANELVLRVQPNEGITIQLWVKKPGYDRDLQQLSLDFTYSNHYVGLPEAYERVLVDAIRSDRSLFATSDEVLESWRILEPVQQYWSMHSDDLKLYDSGSSIEDVLAQ